MTSAPPKVSVVIPSWNAQNWIRETIESVLAQTWKHVEIVVVDDGSADQTVSILESFGTKINLIVQENAGNSAARNRGINASTGDYVAFLDNDDIWLPSKIEAQVRLAEGSPEIGLVFCDYESFGGEPAPNGFARGPVLRSLLTKQIGVSGRLIVDPGAAERILDDLYCQIPSTWLFRRSALLELGGFEPQLRNGAEDFHLAYRTAIRHRLAYDERALVRRRERDDSLGRRSNMAISYVRALSLLAEDQTLNKSTRTELAARAASSAHHLGESLNRTDKSGQILRLIAWRHASDLPLYQAVRVRLRVACGTILSKVHF